MLDKDAEVITDCLHVIELEPSNHVAYFMMAKAKKATNDVFGAIADLTRSISLKYEKGHQHSRWYFECKK